MPDRDLLRQLASASPANEAEVETRVLLHLFRELGYTDRDRADKPPVAMYFGRERKTKYPDFILYDGFDRTRDNALVAVEAKAPDETLDEAEAQVVSYAAWAGTPIYLASNGQTFVAAQLAHGTDQKRVLRFRVEELVSRWDEIEEFLQKIRVVLLKETLGFLTTTYIPYIDRLPPEQFFKEYLDRSSQRFAWTATVGDLFVPGGPEIQLPVSVSPESIKDKLTSSELAELLLSEAGARWWIEGAPGSGKSTLAHRLMRTLLERVCESGSKILPVFVRLSAGFPSSAEEAFSLACRAIGLRLFPQLQRRFLARMRMIAILDGVDEVADGTIVSGRLRLLSEAIGDGAIILTSRPDGRDAVEDGHLQGCRNYHVRDLDDGDLARSVTAFLGDVRLEKEFWAYAARHPEIRVPMITLLTLRVARERGTLRDLTQFALFREYIKIAVSYFNAPAVRGKSTSSADTAAALEAISSAALLIRRHSGREEKPLSLGDLRDALEKTVARDVVAAVLNSGLITSSVGAARFVHEAFGDFGLAWKIVSSLRTGQMDSLASVPGSQNAYAMAREELGPDGDRLIAAALTSTNNKARQRGADLLLSAPSKELIPIALSRLAVEKATDAGRTLARFLMRYAMPEFLAWLNVQGNLSRRKALQIAFAARAEHAHELIPCLFLNAGKSPAIVRYLFKILMARSDVSIEYAQRAADLVTSFDKSERRSVYELMLDIDRRSPFLDAFARAAAGREDSAPAALNLLEMLPSSWPVLPGADLEHLRVALSSGTEWSKSDRRIARALMVTASKVGPLPPAAKQVRTVLESIKGS